MFKQGISPVIGSVILIAIVMTAGVAVWGFVQNLLDDNLSQAGSCLNIFEKATINEKYTCFNSQSGYLDISIGIKDIEIEELTIIVSGNKKSSNYVLTQNPTSVSSLSQYTSATNTGQNIKLPSQNSGETYKLDTSSTGADFTEIDSIEIYPTIEGKKCSKTDSLNEIPRC